MRDNDLFGALVYDLKHFMGEDYRGLLSTPRTISLFDLILWIRHLPEDSALHRKHVAGATKPSDNGRLLTYIINELRIANHDFRMANLDEKEARQVQEPVLIDIPV